MRDLTRSIATIVLLALGLACSGGGGGAPGLTPEGLRNARLEAAMAGLVYSEDGVALSPDSPVPSGDLAAARGLAAAGEELLARNRVVEAIRELVAAVLTAPELSEPYVALGRALQREGRPREALGCFREAHRRGFDPAAGGFWIGAVEHSLGRLDDALASWREVVAAAPGHGPSQLRLAALLFERGELGAARRHLAAAVAAGELPPSQLVAALEGAGLPRVTAVADAGDEVAVGPQVRLDVTGTGARVNETTGAALAGVPQEVVAGWNDYREPGAVRAGFGVSLDGGATWTDQLVRPEPPYRCATEGDPMSAVDPRTGTLWAGAIAFELVAGETGGLYIARKDPGATSFEPAVIAATGFRDKGWMAAGPLPGLPDTTRLHVVHADGYQYSDDLGDSFTGVTPLAFGVGFLPRVGPDGELYIAYWNAFNAVMLKRSSDGGTSFDLTRRIATRLDPGSFDDAVQLPGTFRAPPLAAFAVDPVVGTLYCVYFDTTAVVGTEYDLDLYLTRSTDRGESWSTPAVLDFSPTGDQFFPWLEVDDAGRLHLLFYDTRHTVQSDTDPSAFIDAYYAASQDGGQTWVQHRLTPAPFDSAITQGSSGQFIGDYLGMALADNRAYPVYMGEHGGGPAIYSNVVEWPGRIFADDFEPGDTSSWSGAAP